ncbi:thylakoid lumenal protein TL20.3, chloroplastic [Primulina tabacum]|uniref:thylakoid lumenal protein TL20.3, chloroplastic n=1 Tax=Primulina tabacum TaxID=48773 RepID=UPI003F5A8960
MALSSISLLPLSSINKISSSKISDKNLTSFHVSSKPSSVSCQYETEKGKPGTEPKWWRNFVSTALAAAAAAAFSSNIPAIADLNKFEAETRGEFGIGSAAQYGSADLKKAVHVNENFRRANFTSADMRESDFSGSTFNGAYLEKAVAYKANFTGADLSDTLMDRMVLNEANLTNAVLVRSVLTRSDLGGAIIEGADFSDAVIDLLQKQALCKYASGTNPVTGMSTRKSLGCGNTRRNAYGSPSSPLLSAPPPKLLDRDGFCDPETGLCDAS